MTYKININNIFKSVSFLIFCLVLAIGVLIVFYNLESGFSFIVVLFFCYFSLTFLPAVYLAIEYYYYNKGSSLSLEENNIILEENGVSHQLESIINVEMICSFAKKRGSDLQFFPSESFSLLVIKTHSETFYLSNYMFADTKEIYDYLPADKKIQTATFFPSIALMKWGDRQNR